MVVFHPPNEGKRKPQYLSKLIRLGLRPGVSDLIFAVPPDGRMHALELKAKGGRPTENQKQFIADVICAGGRAAVCDTIDGALQLLKDWGVVRKGKDNDTHRGTEDPLF